MTVRDNGSPPLSTKCQVVLTPERPPARSDNRAPRASDEHISVSIDAKAFTVIHKLSASDADGDTLWYRFEGGLQTVIYSFILLVYLKYITR